MFRSSKKSTSRFPIGAVGILGSFLDDVLEPRCTSIDVVRLEKFIPSNTFFWMSRSARYGDGDRLGRAAVSHEEHGFARAAEAVEEPAAAPVSTVGTRMVANFASGSISNGFTMDFQVNHFWCQQYSYRDALGSWVAESPAVEAVVADVRLMNLSIRSRSLKPCF